MNRSSKVRSTPHMGTRSSCSGQRWRRPDVADPARTSCSRRYGRSRPVWFHASTFARTFKPPFHCYHSGCPEACSCRLATPNVRFEGKDESGRANGNAQPWTGASLGPSSARNGAKARDRSSGPLKRLWGGCYCRNRVGQWRAPARTVPSPILRSRDTSRCGPSSSLPWGGWTHPRKGGPVRRAGSSLRSAA